MNTGSRGGRRTQTMAAHAVSRERKKRCRFCPKASRPYGACRRSRRLRCRRLRWVLLRVLRRVLRSPIQFPPGGQAEHVEQVGFSGLGGRFGGFKIAIKHTADDKWYLYTGHSFDQGWSIVDVTDPKNPRYVKFIPFATSDKNIITSQVTLHDNLMITSLNTFEPQKNPLPAVLLWDISDPENPKQVGS